MARYQAEASASSRSSRPVEASAALPLRSTAVRRTPCGADAGGPDAQLAVALRGRDGEDRVVVRVGPPRGCVAGLPRRVVVGDVERRAGRPRRDELLQRLGALAALADRADRWRRARSAPPGGRREARRRRLRRTGCRRPSPGHAPRGRRRGARRSRAARRRPRARDRRRGADRHAAVLARDPVETGAREQERPLGLAGGRRRAPASRSCRPATTVTPSPSPNAASASSAEAGKTTLMSRSATASDSPAVGVRVSNQKRLRPRPDAERLDQVRDSRLFFAVRPA